MTTTPKNIVQYLEMLKTMRGGVGPEAFYLEHGEAFGPVVPGIEKGEPKRCFNNAFNAATDGRLDPNEWFYAEGYAINPAHGLAINHAWLVNRAGEVMEVSPHWPEDSVYFGVPFRRDYLITSALETGYPSPVWTFEMFNEGLADADLEDFKVTLCT